jgi:hypothetical protein
MSTSDLRTAAKWTALVLGLTLMVIVIGDVIGFLWGMLPAVNA